MKNENYTVYEYAESEKTDFPVFYDCRTGDFTDGDGIGAAARHTDPIARELSAAGARLTDFSGLEFECDDDVYDEIYRSIYNLVYLFIVSLWLNK